MILYDTGAIVAAANVTDQHHHACVTLLTGLRLARRRLLVPATVVAETGYLIRKHSSRAEVAFVRSLSNGDFEPVELLSGDYARMAELMETYIDRPMGVTDASVIAIAERLGVTEIACTDRTDFRIVRPRHIPAFTLLPEGIG
ncbi:MAG: PIN domain-containing protein [Microlunatus sp.]